jgi:hypothetical protein
MAYDQADGYVLLFGGSNGSAELGDTWSFTAGAWAQITTSTGPDPRASASMAYDAEDGYVFLFGGGNQTHIFDDSWSYSGGVWSLVPTSGVPEARDNAQMTYDSEDGYVLLFSGLQPGSTSFGSTWTYLAGTWTNITATAGTSPPPTAFGGMADDTYDGYVLMYGGFQDYPFGFSTNETWSFSNGGWTLLSPATNPGTNVDLTLVTDPPDNSVLLFGGESAGTWLY